MMVGQRPAVLFLLLGGLFALLLGGCGSTSPEMRDAETAYEEGNYQAALSNIERVVSRDTVSADAYRFQATILRRLADSTMEPDGYADLYRRAYAAEEEAVSVSPGLRPDVDEERRRVYDQEVARGELAYNRANKNEDEELYRRAGAFFGAAAATQPDSARPLLNEAYARLQMGQRKRAVPALEEYIERADTAEQKAYKVLGRIYSSSGEGGKAKDLLDQGVRMHPEERELQALRLNVYNRLGDVDEVLMAYREQVERAPEAATYRYNYGALLLKAHRYDEAIVQLTAAVDLRPQNAEGQYNLGAAYVNAALARDDSIAAIKENGPTDSTRDGEEQIERLAERRTALFSKAVPPLDRARQISQGRGTIQRDACRALLVAYVQTDRPNKAAEVEPCAGFRQAGR